MKLLILTALTALAAAQAAAAQPRPVRGDANADGRLSQAEFQAVQTQRMMRMDVDGDGSIRLAEWTAGRRANGGDPAKAFAALDRNRDGGVDAAELGAHSARRFARIDADRDGQLTTAERRASMQERRAPRAAATP